MRLLFVADGRSAIALNWIRYFVEAGHVVHLASTYPCASNLPLASLNVIPVAFSGALETDGGGLSQGRPALIRRLVPVGLRTAARQWLGLLTLPRAARRLRQLIDEIQPDLVHAMRIPFEGILAAQALQSHSSPPLLISVWGNDFTLHAPSNTWLGDATRLTLDRANALHADVQRDVRLAREWGFSAQKPAIVLPGAGGIQLDVFYPVQTYTSQQVINPRGWRAYVRNDTFFHAIPLVLQRQPGVRFVCPALAGEPQALEWIEKLGIAGAVEMLPLQSRIQMAEHFRSSQVVVSVTTHDGTPNTLLEAMACGCTPVAGDIESLREWITPGENGLLVDPGDPQALAEAILQALADPALRARALEINTRLVAERAEYRRVMSDALNFYGSLSTIG